MSYDQVTDERPGLFADLCAKIDIQIGAIDRMADRVTAELKRNRPAAPVFGRAAGTVVIANNFGVVRLNNDGPDQGHFWYIRSIAVGGLATVTAAAGRADVFVSAQNLSTFTSLAQIGLADWRDQAGSLPLISFYGRGELPMRMNENIYIVFSGATNGQTYVATVQYEDFDETSLLREEFSI